MRKPGIRAPGAPSSGAPEGSRSPRQRGSRELLEPPTPRRRRATFPGLMVGAAGWTPAPWPPVQAPPAGPLLPLCCGGEAVGPPETRCIPHPPLIHDKSAQTPPKHSNSGCPSGRKPNAAGRLYLEVLDEFAVVKLDGRGVAGLGQGQAEPHRRPFLGFSPGPIPAGTTSCPGRCLHLSASAQVQIALILQSAFPGFGGGSGCEGRQGDKLHFSRFGHLDELAASLRTQEATWPNYLTVCAEGGSAEPRRLLSAYTEVEASSATYKLHSKGCGGRGKVVFFGSHWHPRCARGPRRSQEPSWVSGVNKISAERGHCACAYPQTGRRCCRGYEMGQSTRASSLKPASVTTGATNSTSKLV